MNARRPTLRVAVLASGRGSNFKAIAAAQRLGALDIDIVGLFSDKPNSRAVQIANGLAIPVCAMDAKKYTDRAAFDREFFACVADCRPDLVVLAGFMRVIDDAVVEKFRGRAINIHPSLLPKYPGLRTHQRALEARDRTHGASVHFVMPQLDGGPVISCVEIDVRNDDTPESLAARLLPLEHTLLVATIALFAQHRIALVDDAVEFDQKKLTRPLKLADDGQLYI